MAVIWPVGVAAESIRVAVAANFYPTLKQLAAEFERQSDHNVDLILGSSGKLAAQIVQGAPYDLFLSADEQRPRLLAEKGAAIADSQVVYARGQLALLTRGENLNDRPETRLQEPGVGRLAMANPNLAPYGRAAQQGMTRLDVVVAPNQIVYGENVSQVFHFIETGQVEFAFVAYAQILAENIADDRFYLLPAALYDPIEQHMILVSHKPAARLFYDYLISDEGQRHIYRSGYLPIYRSD